MDRLTLEGCEEIYMNGFADQVSGNVEAPTGHFYRIGHCIVVTDDNGNREFNAYESEDEAIEIFLELNSEYGDWAIENGENHA